ncbi:type III secretion system cytoplasmic ring protein SctQ [Erwiniaceae bacterium BAC15a-03b]|uniref:Surface presentation of antigens protein SpaO n=1 Tax=Winslowiella arboricola TaxID=2978220 RepID=A0A9J6PH83_9GAMM|nr:type III secretion system cytoplasmic ring protein SctQ [Winslowiella arboricola]MCU5773763.1 type III secretion system cytoplasmic ring protein SctQ [Winslowiella arboricola]MCU5777673.1 type III secretion system cytoplasmic ring protein SctQ [Winslowiella arboricola]
MKTLPLRHYDAASSGLRSVCHHWQALGMPVRMGCPPPGAVLAQAASAGGSQLLVDLRAWFGHSLPEKSGLRADLISADEIRDLFHYSGALLHLNLPGEATESLSISSLVASADYCTGSLPVVSTSCGDGWLIQAAEGYRRQLGQHLPSLLHEAIPLRLDFVVGCSMLSLRYVRKLETGDVLLVNQLTERVMTGGRSLAKYRQQDDYFMLEDIYNDMDEQDYFPGQHDHNAIQQQRMGINNIPLQLTFVINQLTLTLDELSALHIGDVLPAGEGGENSIIIYANGALLAKGELVMVDERLGVEIQTLCHEARYGK